MNVNILAERLTREIVDFPTIPVGTMIRWKVRIEKTQQLHHYAAIFVKTGWNTTAPAPTKYLQPTMTHEALMNYFRDDEGLEFLEVATAFEELDIL